MKKLVLLIVGLGLLFGAEENAEYYKNQTQFCSVGLCLREGGEGVTGKVIYLNRYNRVEKTELYKEGKLDGITGTFHLNGEKKEEISYVQGQKDGPAYTYDDKGRKTSFYNYKAGLLEGEAYTYYPDASSSPKEEKRYENGKLSGLYKSQYQNGLKKSEGNFVEGKLDGEYLEFWENGVARSKIVFSKGKATEGSTFNTFGKETKISDAKLYTLKIDIE